MRIVNIAIIFNLYHIIFSYYVIIIFVVTNPIRSTSHHQLRPYHSPHYPLLATAILTTTIATRITRAGQASHLVAATSATPCQMPAGPFFLICPSAGHWHLINSAPRCVYPRYVNAPRGRPILSSHANLHARLYAGHEASALMNQPWGGARVK